MGQFIGESLGKAGDFLSELGRFSQRSPRLRALIAECAEQSPRGRGDSAWLYSGGPAKAVEWSS
jgi:hypothetical protein